MLNAIKGLITSKKFILTIIGTAVVNIMVAIHVPMEIIAMVAGFFGVNVAAIGLQDLGKEAAKPK